MNSIQWKDHPASACANTILRFGNRSNTPEATRGSSDVGHRRLQAGCDALGGTVAWRAQP